MFLNQCVVLSIGTRLDSFKRLKLLKYYLHSLGTEFILFLGPFWN